MSYNGSGTFVVNSSGQPVVTGTVISSTAFNALTADLATGLSTAITKDGQTTTTARIVFAQGVSSTLVTDATSSTTGSIISAGGISCQKAAVVGTLLGVGMAPVNVLDITQTQNASSAVSILNSSAGTAATSDLKVNNGTSVAVLRQNGASYTTSGVFRADGTLIYGTGAGGISIITQPAQPIYFGINNAEVARFDTSGNYMLGSTSAAGSAKFSVTQAASAPAIYTVISRSGATYTSDATSVDVLTTTTATGWNYFSCYDRAAAAYRLFIRGDGNVTNANGSYGTISDEDYKKWDHLAAPDFRQGIKDLWLGWFDRYDDREKTKGEKRMFGVRAQQANATLGGIGVVPPAKAGDPWTAQAEPFAFVALWGVKDLYAENEALKASIADLTTRLAALENK